MIKKAQGLSLNVIIIAALGLLVLVVLAIIFTGRTGIFVREIEKCSETTGGSCVATEIECSGTYSRIVARGCDLNGDGKYTAAPEDGYCCVTVAPTGT